MRILTVLILSCLISGLAALDVGAKAPSLDSVQWVKGQAPDFSKQVTVVEFWATWCGPCLQSIPHLTELAKKHGEQLAIAGISDEPVETIKPFVEEQGATMDYNVGSLSEEAYQQWMGGVSGIPHAYIVGTDGTVLWQGHPMSMDRPLAQALAGTLDPEQAKAVSERERALQQSFQTRDMGKIREAAEALLAVAPAHEQGLYVLRAVAQQEEDPAIFRSYIEGIQAEQLDAEQLADLATQLLTADDLRYRMLEQAVAFARQAKQAAPEQPQVLATWAHARYLLGDLAGAIRFAEQAQQRAQDDQLIATRLDYYRQAQQLAQEQQETAAKP